MADDQDDQDQVDEDDPSTCYLCGVELEIGFSLLCSQCQSDAKRRCVE